VAGCCENGDEPWDSIQCGEMFGLLSSCVFMMYRVWSVLTLVLPFRRSTAIY
jgi:hypothetical protein